MADYPPHVQAAAEKVRRLLREAKDELEYLAEQESYSGHVLDDMAMGVTVRHVLQSVTADAAMVDAALRERT